MTRIVQSSERKCDAQRCSLSLSAAASDHNSLSGMEGFSASIARRRSMAPITLTIRRRMRAAVRITWDNFALACLQCNQEKHSKTLEEYRAWLRDRGEAVLFSVGKLAAGSRAAISASRSVQRKRAPILPSFVRLTKAKLDSPKVGQWNFLALGTRLPCVVHTLNYSDRFIFHRRAICLRTNWDRSMRRNNHDRVSITCGRDNIAHVTLKCWFKIFFDDGCNYVPVTMRRRVGI